MTQVNLSGKVWDNLVVMKFEDPHKVMRLKAEVTARMAQVSAEIAPALAHPQGAGVGLIP